ncbi:hypothetical protein RJ640_008656, partial [Escallonia rubra]
MGITIYSQLDGGGLEGNQFTTNCSLLSHEWNWGLSSNTNNSSSSSYFSRHLSKYRSRQKQYLRRCQCHIMNLSRDVGRKRASSMPACLHSAAAAAALRLVSAAWTAAAAPRRSFAIVGFHPQRKNMDVPAAQEMSYGEHVKRRHEEKGCLYAWSVLLPILPSTLLCMFLHEEMDVSVHVSYSPCVAAFAALRLVSAAWTFSAAAVLRLVYNRTTA